MPPQALPPAPVISTFSTRRGVSLSRDGCASPRLSAWRRRLARFPPATSVQIQRARVRCRGLSRVRMEIEAGASVRRGAGQIMRSSGQELHEGMRYVAGYWFMSASEHGQQIDQPPNLIHHEESKFQIHARVGNSPGPRPRSQLVGHGGSRPAVLDADGENPRGEPDEIDGDQDGNNATRDGLPSLQDHRDSRLSPGRRGKDTSGGRGFMNLHIEGRAVPLCCPMCYEVFQEDPSRFIENRHAREIGHDVGLGASW